MSNNTLYIRQLSKRSATSAALFFLILIMGCKAPMIDESLAVDESIRLNQIGFYPNQKKIAVILNHEESEDFFIWDLDKKDIVYEGKLAKEIAKTYSGINSRIADFSEFNEIGNFVFVLS